MTKEQLEAGNKIQHEISRIRDLRLHIGYAVSGKLRAGNTEHGQRFVFFEQMINSMSPELRGEFWRILAERETKLVSEFDKI